MHVHANRTREPAASREFVEDIRNTEKICSVALNGRRLGRGDLDALLADAEQFCGVAIDPRLREGPGTSECERRGFAWRVEERHGHDLSGNGFARGFHR